jgi:hypothetical protein
LPWVAVIVSGIALAASVLMMIKASKQDDEPAGHRQTAVSSAPVFARVPAHTPATGIAQATARNR